MIQFQNDITYIYNNFVLLVHLKKKIIIKLKYIPKNKTSRKGIKNSSIILGGVSFRSRNLLAPSHVPSSVRSSRMPDTFLNPNLVFVRPIHGVDIIVAWLHNGKNRSACIHFSPFEARAVSISYTYIHMKTKIAVGNTF